MTDIVQSLRDRAVKFLQEAALLESAANEIEKLELAVRDLTEKSDSLVSLPSCEAALKKSDNIVGLPTPDKSCPLTGSLCRQDCTYPEEDCPWVSLPKGQWPKPTASR